MNMRLNSWPAFHRLSAASSTVRWFLRGSWLPTTTTEGSRAGNSLIESMSSGGSRHGNTWALISAGGVRPCDVIVDMIALSSSAVVWLIAEIRSVYLIVDR